MVVVGVTVGTVIYLSEPTVESLLVLSSILCLTVSFALGIAVEQYHVRSRMVVLFALVFLFLSLSTTVMYWLVFSSVTSLVPGLLVATFLELPIDLRLGRHLLEIYEAQRSPSEPRNRESAGNPDKDM